MRFVNDEGDVLTIVEIDPSIATVTFEIRLSGEKVNWSQTASIETLCKLLDEERYKCIEEDE